MEDGVGSIVDGSEVQRRVDRWGRAIVLTTARWTLHILPDRDPLLGNETALRQTLVDPHFVQHDATRTDRENFYRFGPLPAPFDHLDLKVCVKVCVEFAEPNAAGNAAGRVVTAFPTHRVRPTEQRTWP